MKTVIKLAGALLEDDATVRSLARQIAALAQQGHEILVVHGGGRVFTATLQRMGIESNFVAGLRVTNRETRDVAVMVFAGQVKAAPRTAHVIDAGFIRMASGRASYTRCLCGWRRGAARRSRRGCWCRWPPLPAPRWEISPCYVHPNRSKTAAEMAASTPANR